MNATVGLAGGMVQCGYLGSQGLKYILLALRWIVGKIFNRRNITTPLKFASNLVIGTEFGKPSSPVLQIDKNTLEYFEFVWR